MDPAVLAGARTRVRGSSSALFELERCIDEGLTSEEFEATRNYLAKKAVFVMTQRRISSSATRSTALWYGTGEFTSTMREAMSKLTVSEVNQAVRRHLSARDLSVVMVAPDGAALREQLLSSEPATIVYDAPKPQEITDEDRVVGARNLGVTPRRYA